MTWHQTINALFILLISCAQLCSFAWRLEISKLSAATFMFRRYDESSAAGCAVRAQTWVISDAGQIQNGSSFHRFFDSSPFSPSGRLIAFTRTQSEGSQMRHSATAEVVIVDLVSGEERVVARTAAWGAQLGAQVQWGATDDFVLFNKIVKQSHSNRAEGSMDSSQYRIAGVQLQLSTLKMTVFPCSIYHVSGDGKMAVTPKMSSMHLSQPGYGARIPADRSSVRPPEEDDDVQVLDLETGRCKRLLSMRNVSSFLGLPPKTPTYAFHVKLSSDSKLVMIIARNLIERWNIKSAAKKLFRVNGRGDKSFYRRSHILVADADTGRIITYVLSFSGAGGRPVVGKRPGDDVLVDGVSFRNYFGNHPNWIHGTHNIGMNLAFSPLLKKSTTLRFDIIIISFGRGDCSPEQYFKKGCPQIVFNLEGSYLGSGHSLFLPGGRYVLVDAYAKESKLFSTNSNCSNADYTSVPLRIIDLQEEISSTLLEVPVHFAQSTSSTPRRDEWRCDLHPATSRDAAWVAINGRPDGGFRQILITYIGNEPSSFFPA